MKETHPPQPFDAHHGTRDHVSARCVRSVRRRRRHDRRALTRRWSALVVLLFVLSLPLALISGPNTSPKRSPLYPTPPPGLNFAHSKHAKVSCGVCHTGAKTSVSASQDLAPKMQACVPCHATKKGRAKPPIAQCAGCHVGLAASNSAVTREEVGKNGEEAKPNSAATTGAAKIVAPITTPAQWRAVRPAPKRRARGQAHVKFNHAAHLARMKKLQILPQSEAQTCATCHRADAQGAPSMPSMKQCAGCHDGARAPSTCVTCHLDDRGKLRTALHTRTAGKITRTVTLKPRDHTRDWRKRHGPIARVQGDTCMQCHTEPSCAQCHDDKRGRALRAHPPNYLIIHRAAARADMTSCTSCHKQETFCASCHARTRNTTVAGARPPARRKSFHPPGWVRGLGATGHGVMARRNINDCASCHQERDCVTCHTAINPHGPAFQARCGALMRSNPTPCARCHTTDMAAIRARCR